MAILLVIIVFGEDIQRFFTEFIPTDILLLKLVFTVLIWIIIVIMFRSFHLKVTVNVNTFSSETTYCIFDKVAESCKHVHFNLWK